MRLLRFFDFVTTAGSPGEGMDDEAETGRGDLLGTVSLFVGPFVEELAGSESDEYVAAGKREG